jgi:peptidoglycan/LPS O-acetylase OafA/YrhL
LFLARRSGLALPIDGFFLDGRWLLFAAGILVYYRATWARGAARWFALVPLLGALAWSLQAPSKLATPQSNFWQELFVAASFALVIALLQPLDSRLAHTPWLRPLRLAGQRCYSLYLVHVPVVKIVSHAVALAGLRTDLDVLLISAPVGVGLTVALGELFYRQVELRFRNPPAPGSELTPSSVAGSIT